MILFSVLDPVGAGARDRRSTWHKYAEYKHKWLSEFANCEWNTIVIFCILFVHTLDILYQFMLTIDKRQTKTKEYIWFIYQIGPFFSDLKNLLETKNNSRFYILKLFSLLHGSRFSCPVTSLVNISLQSWCILFKKRKNRRFWPNKCFLLLS